MLWALLGDYGSGKTLRMVLEGVSDNREILGNFILKLPNYRKITPKELKNFGFNKLVLLDELYLWLEPRRSSSAINLYISYILNQCRHRTIDVFGSMHFFTQADLRFRLTVNRIIKCERIPKRNVHYDFWDFKYSTINTYNGNIKVKRLKYEKAIKYFDLFDTYEIMDALDEPRLEYEVMKRTDPIGFTNRAREISEVIKDDLEVITKATVRFALMEKGYIGRWADDIFPILKYRDNVKKDTISKSNKRRLIKDYPL